MTNSKEKEVRSRFDLMYGLAPKDSLKGRKADECFDFLLSELLRVEKETENRVWREASEIALKSEADEARGWDLDAEHIGECCPGDDCADIYNHACKDISSTLLSQVKQDE
jgi:hypothetical protein